MINPEGRNLRREILKKEKSETAEPRIETTEEKRAKVEEMAKYWKAGFGGAAAAAAVSAGLFILDRDEKGRDEDRKHSEGLLSAMERTYSEILFSELNKETDEFKPLFEINDLIPELKKEYNKLWENPTELLSKEIFLIGKHIFNLGRLYDVYAQRLVWEIRKIPANEDYKNRLFKRKRWSRTVLSQILL